MKARDEGKDFMSNVMFWFAISVVWLVSEMLTPNEWRWDFVLCFTLVLTVPILFIMDKLPLLLEGSPFHRWLRKWIIPVSMVYIIFFGWLFYRFV